MSRITLDMPEEDVIEPGHWLRSEAGSCWAVGHARLVRRREPTWGQRRWAIHCERVRPEDVPSDAVVHEFRWYPRRRRV